MDTTGRPDPGPPGSLIVVGTGFMVAGHVTPEARAAMEGADRLLHLVSDAATRSWIESLNPANESLYDAYGEGRPRVESYEEMVQRILAPVREGADVCAAFYGHPGVFVYPSHEAVRRAREEGHRARMLPGVSAEDCLFADLGLDPAIHGIRSYEATDFLVSRRPIDPTSGLVLWQVGAIGVTTFYKRSVWRTEGLAILADALLEHYPPSHEVVVYTAATLPFAEAEVHRLRLDALAAPPEGIEVSVAATLYVPPARRAPLDAEAARRLDLAPDAP
jgi:precorrin-3B methylase